MCKNYVRGLITYSNLSGMNLKSIRFLLLFVFALFFTHLSAQRLVKDEYRAEIGINTGGSFYIGDANSILFKNMQLSNSGYFRYKFDQRLALKAELAYTTITGIGYNNNLLAGSVCGEFNFFDLEENPYKLNSKTYSPYIFGGLGMMDFVYHGQNPFLPELGITFGVGFKLKLNERWNFNAQWSNCLMFKDNLDGQGAPNVISSLNNPYGLNGSNIFNNDLLSTLTVGLSLNIWSKDCDCRKH